MGEAWRMRRRSPTQRSWTYNCSWLKPWCLSLYSRYWNGDQGFVREWVITTDTYQPPTLASASPPVELGGMYFIAFYFWFATFLIILWNFSSVWKWMVKMLLKTVLGFRLLWMHVHHACIGWILNTLARYILKTCMISKYTCMFVSETQMLGWVKCGWMKSCWNIVLGFRFLWILKFII